MFGHRRFLHATFLCRRKKQSTIDRYINSVAAVSTRAPTLPATCTGPIKFPPDPVEVAKPILWHMGAARFNTKRPGFNGKLTDDND